MTRRARFHVALFLAALVSVAGPGAAQDAPPLPPGLGERPPATQPTDASATPALPEGLSDTTRPPALPPGLAIAETAQEPPALPEGLGQPESERARDTEPAEKEPGFWEPLRLTGFWEVRGGVRTQHDPHEDAASIGETRLQLETERVFFERLTLKVTADVLYDVLADHQAIDLERGQGFLDLRNLNVTFTPLEFMDVRIGRQILTWGTGDLLFLNDLFPKDWQSFFIGRDTEYLKAPSDAIKISLFSEVANWDVVYTPRFDPDRFITGERISYYNPLLLGRAGQNAVQEANIPNRWFHDDEWATRVWKNVKGVELAAYGYWGRWKSPAGQDLLSLNAEFPRLNVYGASARGALAGGIANVEAAYYDSREDRSGSDRFTNNSEFRILAGYERQMPELAEDLTLGAQVYVEWMMNHDEYMRTRIPVLMPARDELRHVVTFRVTKLYMNQNLELSLFAYYSPSDSDAYLRPNISYKIDDHWKAEIGGNVFVGADDHTFFGQFSRNSNVYAALRYSF